MDDAPRPQDMSADRFPLPPAPFTGATRKVPALRALDWIQEGWTLFLGAPRVWLFLGGAIVLMFAVSEFLWLNVRTSFSPSLPRSLVLALLFFGPVVLMPPATAAGLQMCRLLANGNTPDLDDLIDAFRRQPCPLFQAGMLMLGGWLIIYLFYEVIRGPLALFLPTLAGFAFLLSFWFLPALIALHGLPPFAALRAGFAACLKNALPFALFGFTMAILHFVALLPVGLGMIVLLPVVIATLYASYRDIFTES